MSTTRLHHLLAAGALLLATAPVGAQTITGLDVSQATLGETIRVSGSDLGAKPKLVLAQDGAAAKKTKLKVVGAGTEGDADFVDVQIKKAFPGSFQIAVKAGKTLSAISADTVEVVGPRIDSVNPEAALPGDEVDVFIEHAGTGKMKALVGAKKAKIVSVEPVEGDGDGPLSRVTIKVPKVPDGTWPVTFQNLIGIDALKAALDVQGSPVPLGQPSAFLTILGRKPFKASKKLVGVDNKLDATDIGAAQGKKKGLIVSLPLPQDELLPDLTWNLAPANILYTEISKKNGETVWAAEPAGEGASWSIDLVELTEDTIVTYVCGDLTRVHGEGPDTLSVYGTVISPRVEVDTVTEPCEVHFEAEMSISGSWESLPGDDGTGALYNDIGGGAGTTQLEGDQPDEGFSINMMFDPTTQTSATLNGAFQLSGFSYVTPDEQWVSMINKDLSTTMTVQITDVLDATDPQDPWEGYIVGSFSGTLINLATQEVQTCTGTFCSPYLLLSNPGVP